MITKSSAATNIDWKKIDRMTEIKRTYFVKDKDGHWFYKMWTPSYAHFVMNTSEAISKGWKCKIESYIDRSRKPHKDKKPKEIFRERAMNEMMKNREYVY